MGKLNIGIANSNEESRLIESTPVLIQEPIIIEVPVEVIREVRVEVPVEIERIIEVERIVEVPVEKIVEVEVVRTEYITIEKPAQIIYEDRVVEIHNTVPIFAEKQKIRDLERANGALSRLLIVATTILIILVGVLLA